MDGSTSSTSSDDWVIDNRPRNYVAATTTTSNNNKKLNILFIHQNFPGQFKYISVALVQEYKYNVYAMHMKHDWVNKTDWYGIKLQYYNVDEKYIKRTIDNYVIHPYISDLETKIIRADANYKVATEIMKQKLHFYPDIIIAHPGWGESLFIKDVYPNYILLLYCELYYTPNETKILYSNPELFTNSNNSVNNNTPNDDVEEIIRLRIRNLNNQLHFNTADGGISPTYFQASTFPNPFRDEKITVIFDGVDTNKKFIPNPSVTMTLQVRTTGEVIQLNRTIHSNMVITFITRELEPYRGYHIFIKALPILLKKRPNVRIVIVGGSGVSYGSKPDPITYNNQTSWKEIYREELKTKLTIEQYNRIHFVGKLTQDNIIQLLQLSTVHVYLTIPFVLSWSLIEAMSIGCTVIGSNTEPVQEVIQHNVTGILVDFNDYINIANEIDILLDNPTERIRLGTNARKFIQTNYDLYTICLPKQLQWIHSYIGD